MFCSATEGESHLGEEGLKSFSVKSRTNVFPKWSSSMPCLYLYSEEWHRKPPQVLSLFLFLLFTELYDQLAHARVGQVLSGILLSKFQCLDRADENLVFSKIERADSASTCCSLVNLNPLVPWFCNLRLIRSASSFASSKVGNLGLYFFVPPSLSPKSPQITSLGSSLYRIVPTPGILIVLVLVLSFLGILWNMHERRVKYKEK